MSSRRPLNEPKSQTKRGADQISCYVCISFHSVRRKRDVEDVRDRRETKVLLNKDFVWFFDVFRWFCRTWSEFNYFFSNIVDAIRRADLVGLFIRFHWFLVCRWCWKSKEREHGTKINIYVKIYERYKFVITGKILEVCSSPLFGHSMPTHFPLNRSVKTKENFLFCFLTSTQI